MASQCSCVKSVSYWWDLFKIKMHLQHVSKGDIAEWTMNTLYSFCFLCLDLSGFHCLQHGHRFNLCRKRNWSCWNCWRESRFQSRKVLRSQVQRYWIIYTYVRTFLWLLCVADADIIFSSCSLFFLSFFFLRLISAVADWMLPCFHAWCCLSANLGCRSETCCTQLAVSTGRKNLKKSPSGHHRTTLSGYIFTTKACIDNRKKNLLNRNTSSTCPNNMV